MEIDGRIPKRRHSSTADESAFVELVMNSPLSLFRTAAKSVSDVLHERETGVCVASVNNVGSHDEGRPSQDCYIFCSLGLGRQRSPTVVGFYWVLSLFVLKVAVHRGGSGTWIQDFGPHPYKWLRSDFVYAWILLLVGHVGSVASVEDFLSSVEGSECLWLVLCGGYLLDAVVLGRNSGFTFWFVCWFGFEW